MADVRVENHGSIFLVRPESEAARRWVEEHIGQHNGFQPYWPDAVVVEHRYISDIVAALQADGLQVACSYCDAGRCPECG